MNFECLEILGLTQQCDFWGDNINYRNVQNFTVRGRVSGDRNAALIAPAWSGMSGLMTYSSGYLPIYAQGIFLGTGKFTQLQFAGGTDVRDKIFTAGFQILKSGDLSNVTGSTYVGLSGAFEFFPYLNSMTESYQYSQQNNLTTEFTRDINLALEKGYINQVTGVHQILSGVLGSMANLGIYFNPIPTHLSGVEGVTRSINKAVDIINGTLSYSETFNYQSGRSYVHEYQHSLSYEEGIATVSEQGSVQGNRRTSGTGDRMQYTNSGWASASTGIFTRVSGVFTRWQDQFQNSGCPLDTQPMERNITRDYSRGLISYNYSYNNDPAYKSGFYHSYEQSLTINDLGWIDVSINGILNTRQIDVSGALSNLNTHYKTTIYPQVSGYAFSGYSGSINFFKNPYCYGGYSGSLSLLNSKETYANRPAKIEYNFNFTDDPSYFPTGKFSKIKNTISNQEVTALVNTFRIVNFKELPQNSYQSNLGLITNNIEIVGSGATLAEYKTAASGRLVIPSGENWMVQNTYNFSPLKNTFSMSVGYNYAGYRGINDFAI